MNLVQLVENKDYVGFKDKMEELVEESLLKLFKEAKDEITSKAKVDLDESDESNDTDKPEDDKEKDDSKDKEQE
jgi:hypothetical protein